MCSNCRIVTEQQCNIISSTNYKVKPVQKLCASHRNKILKEEKIDNIEVESSLNAQDEEVDDVGLTPEKLLQLQKRNATDELNSSFHEIGCSPMHFVNIADHLMVKKSWKVYMKTKRKIKIVLEIDLPEENDSEIKKNI